MNDERLRWWQEARFGIFVHWGLYSAHGRDVWAMYNEQIPVEEYRHLADQFVPRHYHPREWAALAKDAGAGYMVLCTRQHDGYSLFDSAVSDFTSVRCAAKRDFVAEYAEAVREAGLGVGSTGAGRRTSRARRRTPPAGRSCGHTSTRRCGSSARSMARSTSCGTTGPGHTTGAPGLRTS